MTKEQRFFIQVLSDHIHGRPTRLPDGKMNWPSLAYLAREHQVDGIVYSQCGAFIPEKHITSFEHGYAATLFYYGNRMTEAAKIAAAFKEAGIDYYTVKGLSVAQYYPVPALRTMGDNDFIVSDMSAAIRVMRGLGFEGSDHVKNNEWNCDKGGLHCELHDLLLKNDRLTKKVQADFFADLMPHVKDGVLDWNYHYLFLIVHLYRHFAATGVGMRQFVDIAVLIQNGPELNWPWIEEKLEELELKKFAHACYSLIESWFGIRAPVDFEALDGAEEVTERLLDNGVFGYSNRENLDNAARDFLANGNRPRWANRVFSLLRNIFPPYERMLDYSGCSFIDGRKYLLPVAWGKRFILILCKGNYAGVRKTIGKSFISKEELEDRKAYLRKMGL